MKRYKKYKDSGVQWIGEIPEHWEVKKLKLITEILSCGLAATPQYVDEGVPFISAQNVKNGKLSLDKYNNITSALHRQLTKYKKVKRGDVLQVRVGATIGNTCIVDVDFEFSIYVSLTHLRCNKFMNNKFVKYILDSDLFKKVALLETFQGGGVGNLNVNVLEKIRLPIPKLNEQTQIATYLDHKTSQLEVLIRKKEELIDTLRASRTKLISETVTKGLDKDVEMKDSGVEWIGEIPKDYEMKKLKNICEYIGRGKSPEYEENTGVYTINQACLYWNYFKKENIKSVSKKFYNNLSKDYILNKNDILINSTGGGNLGKSAFFDKTGTLGRVHFYEGDEGYAYDSHVTMIRLKEIYNKKYFYYMFCTKNVHSYIDLFCVNGSTKQIELSKIGLESILIPIPKIEEQQAIATYLDHKTSLIDNLISKIEKQITLLKKAKEKLITEVVTGKINVTDL